MDAEPGALLSTHRIDNRRRARIALTMAVLGAVLIVPAIQFWLTVDERAGKVHSTGDPLLVPTVLVAAPFGLLLIGVIIGIVALVRRDEAFEVHEQGLVHRWSGRTRAVRWTDIAKVVRLPRKNNAFSRWAGGDFSCRVETRTGKNISITGLTEDAEQLVATLEDATA